MIAVEVTARAYLYFCSVNHAIVCPIADPSKISAGPRWNRDRKLTGQNDGIAGVRGGGAHKIAMRV